MFYTLTALKSDLYGTKKWDLYLKYLKHIQIANKTHLKQTTLFSLNILLTTNSFLFKTHFEAPEILKDPNVVTLGNLVFSCMIEMSLFLFVIILQKTLWN